MDISTLGGIIGVTVFVVGYIVYGMIKSGKQMYRLQEMAELYDDAFKRHIYTSMGWKISDIPRKGWYKLVDGNGQAYYIQFDGPIPFQKAVELLIKSFIS